jgi:RNA polymerase sigma-70 factor (ECF subfamily)
MTGSPPSQSPSDLHRDADAALVAAARRDRAAFGPLYDRYAPPIYRYLRSRVGSVAEAEDLTAQTFLAALQAFGRYRHDGHLAAWLFSIARRKAMDHFRRRPPETLDDSHPSDAADPLAQVARSEEIARLSALIRTLGGEEQDLIRLRFVADLPFAEIASVLGKKEDAVKKTLYRLLARLQSQLEDRHG